MKTLPLVIFLDVITRAIDTGQFDKITVQDIQNHINKKDLFPFLASKFKTKLFNLISPADQKTISSLYFDQNSVYSNSTKIRGKWGVQNRGLALLVIWGLEFIGYSFNSKRLKT